MKVLHLASGNRWTGAAAPAFAEVEALRAAGVDAHYAYVGGYKLQAKIGHHDFAHALIAKAQNPFAFMRSLRAIEYLFDHHRFDVVHAHLTYDHWLARFVVRGTRTRVARTFHSQRVLRDDPLTRSLVRKSDALFVVNDTFAGAPLLRGREAIFTPPPLDQRQFDPDGADMRATYGIADDCRVIAAIGKLSKDRGFEAVLESFAAVRRAIANVRLMIIGHGEHRPALEQYAATLGVSDDLIWAGYHEEDLAEHYRTADVLLFTARGSDEGHRAVLEAMSCATIPAVYPIAGLRALLGDLAGDCMADGASPEQLADVVVRILTMADHEPLSRRVQERSDEFNYDRAAERLITAYEGIV